uniref:CCHC-type domain-containing protein n=1 Tax=Bracon brevicornis TaxID=1563983 RepID=A0A6V7L6X8_9HYME
MVDPMSDTLSIDASPIMDIESDDPTQVTVEVRGERTPITQERENGERGVQQHLSKAKRRRQRRERMLQKIAQEGSLAPPGKRGRPPPSAEKTNPRTRCPEKGARTAPTSAIPSDRTGPLGVISGELPPRGPLCYNCKSAYHKYRDCPLPLKEFCRVCGRAKKRLSNCPDCEPAWRARGRYVPYYGTNIPDQEVGLSSPRPALRQAGARRDLREYLQKRRDRERSEERRQNR